jgi:hypothetical protein
LRSMNSLENSRELFEEVLDEDLCSRFLHHFKIKSQALSQNQNST